MIKKWFGRNRYTIAFAALLFCFFEYSIGRIYGFVLYPDEFGYWFYAARAAGYDWSRIVSLGSYYSYGYSLILYPVFVLFKDGVTAYRAAVAVNFILLAVLYLILQSLAKKAFPDIKRGLAAFFVMTAVMYPVTLYYAKTTMAETVLTLMYAVICWLMYDYLEHNRKSTLILLLLAFVYIHFVHMRTVALLAAGLLTLLCRWLRREKSGERKKRIGFYFIVFLAAGLIFALGLAAKQWIFFHIYGGTADFQANDYAGQMEKLTYILSREGILNLFISIAGKLLYLGLASFGLAFWGIWYALKQAKARNYFWLFVLLSTAGATLVSAVYLVEPGRVDALTYGRYHEYVLPVLMLAGLYAMWRTTALWRGTAAIIALQLPLLGMVLYSIHTYRQSNMHAYMMVGMSYWYDSESFEPNRFYLTAYLFGALLTLLLALLTAFIRRKRTAYFLLVLAVAAEIALSFRAAALLTDDTNLGIYRDTVVANRITQLLDEGRRVIYIDGGTQPYISVIQFLLRDVSIEVLEKREEIEAYSDEELSAEDLVLIDYQEDFARELAEKYGWVLVSGHFALYFNK